MLKAASNSTRAPMLGSGPYWDLTGLTPGLGRSLGQKVVPSWRAFVDTLSASLLATAAHQQAAHDLLGHKPSESSSTREILEDGVSVAKHMVHVLATTYAAADRTGLVSVEHDMMSRELGERAGNVPAELHGVDREVALRRAIEAFDPVAVGDWLDVKYSDVRNFEALVARVGSGLRRSWVRDGLDVKHRDLRGFEALIARLGSELRRWWVVARREDVVRLVHRLDAFPASDSNLQSARALIERIRVAAVLAWHSPTADALAASAPLSVHDLYSGVKIRWPDVTLVAEVTQVRIEIDQPFAGFLERLMDTLERPVSIRELAAHPEVWRRQPG